MMRHTISLDTTI